MLAPLLLLAMQVTATHRPDLNSEHTLRASFVTAAESVIDMASTITFAENTAASDAQRAQLQTNRDNLAKIVDSPVEKEAVSDINDMLFAVSACIIQARNGSDTTQCKGQFDRARRRAMEAIGKHKIEGRWADGPPA